MFYLYDLATYTTSYGSIPKDGDFCGLENRSAPHDDEEEAHDWALRARRGERLQNIDEAIQTLGLGTFQYQLGMAAGLLLAANSIEAVILSYLSSVSRAQMAEEILPYKVYPDALDCIEFAASLTGSLFFGIVGDTFGRKVAYLCTATLIAIFSVCTVVDSSYAWLLTTRFMVGFGIGGSMVPFCMLSEVLPPSLRGAGLVIAQVFWSIGTLAVHLTIKNRSMDEWRQVVLLCSIPGVIAVILGLTVVPESPRWLLSKGRQVEAIQVLRAAAQKNGKDPIHLFPLDVTLFSLESHGTTNMLGIFSASGWVKVSAIIGAIFFGQAFLDHGTVALAVSVFGNDDRHQDYQAIFSVFAEVTGLLLVLLTIDILGRSTSQAVAYVLGGTTCLVVSLLEESDSIDCPNLLIVLTFLAHAFMVGGTSASWIAVTEVLATEVRASGHATANVFALVGGSLSSYVLSNIYSSPASGLALFLVSLWTASTVTKLPETSGKEMGVSFYPAGPHASRGRNCHS